MHKISILIITILFISQITNAQKMRIQRSVMSISGFSTSVSNKSNTYLLQQSIGQKGITGTAYTKNKILIQGYIQPNIVFNDLLSQSRLDVKLSKTPYSNKYSGIIFNLKSQTFVIQVFDLSGKRLYFNTIKNSKTFTIDLNNYIPGYYILNVNTNFEHYSIKIVKN